MVSRIPLQAFGRKCFGGLTTPGIRHFLGPETQPLSDPRRPLLPLQQTQVEIVQAFKRISSVRSNEEGPAAGRARWQVRCEDDQASPRDPVMKLVQHREFQTA